LTKKLLGSGGYVLAKLTEQEELRASLGVPPEDSLERS
jgi:hypothetical protein